MGTLTRKAFDRKSMPEYPFDIGYRYVKDGQEWVQIPLTEEDFLHPEEEDQFLCTDAHSVTVTYLRQAIEIANQHRFTLRVFSDHRTDWEEPDIRPMRPDVAVYDHFEGEWNSHEGTLPVHEMEAVPLLVIEVTSPSTRNVDLGRKPPLYDDAKVPYFLIFDFYSSGLNEFVPELLAFRRTKRGYVRMKADADLGVWVPSVEMWFRFEGETVVAFNAKKERILTGVALAQRLDEETKRADALENELAELRAKLANQPTKKNGHK